ncbi:uncharacterized protein [Chironomus tepperi]|uniref:uncharacterized protein n=1 Tax=Chironomus tepperi TaxID=113505 RepID=UPI00391F382E
MKLLVLSIFVLVALTVSHSHPDTKGKEDQQNVTYLGGDEDNESSTIKEGRWNKTKKFFKKTINKATNLFKSNPNNTSIEASGVENIAIIDESSEEVYSSTTETIGFWKRVKNIW